MHCSIYETWNYVCVKYNYDNISRKVWVLLLSWNRIMIGDESFRCDWYYFASNCFTVQCILWNLWKKKWKFIFFFWINFPLCTYIGDDIDAVITSASKRSSLEIFQEKEYKLSLRKIKKKESIFTQDVVVIEINRIPMNSHANDNNNSSTIMNLTFLLSKKKNSKETTRKRWTRERNEAK